MASNRRQVPFGEWWNMLPSPKGYYKDCRIIDFDKVSERYILLVLQIPQPRGGTYEELVEMTTLIETE